MVCILLHLLLISAKRYGQCELTNSVWGGAAHVGKGYGQCQLTTSAGVGTGECATEISQMLLLTDGFTICGLRRHLGFSYVGP